MRVQQLEDLLARLPADMPVLISAGGPGAWHIGLVQKFPRRTLRFPSLGTEVEAPASLHLENGYYWDGSRRLWHQPEPEPLILGRWPKPKESVHAR